MAWTGYDSESRLSGQPSNVTATQNSLELVAQFTRHVKQVLRFHSNLTILFSLAFCANIADAIHKPRRASSIQYGKLASEDHTLMLFKHSIVRLARDQETTCLETLHLIKAPSFRDNVHLAWSGY